MPMDKRLFKFPAHTRPKCWVRDRDVCQGPNDGLPGCAGCDAEILTTSIEDWRARMSRCIKRMRLCYPGRWERHLKDVEKVNRRNGKSKARQGRARGLS